MIEQNTTILLGVDYTIRRNQKMLKQPFRKSFRNYFYKYNYFVSRQSFRNYFYNR